VNGPAPSSDQIGANQCVNQDAQVCIALCEINNGLGVIVVVVTCRKNQACGERKEYREKEDFFHSNMLFCLGEILG
jgi:hypothetical protein